MSLRSVTTFAVLVLIYSTSAPVRAAAPCRVELVDKQNGWPVPLVELRTTHDLVMVTDNAGVIAIDQPELMNREIWFGVSGQGYSVRRDGFGSRGVRLTPRSGETLRVELDRTIIAKRLGRLTGGGIFAESQKLGQRSDWRESGVFGCDSVQVAQHRGKCFWLWGDTDLPFYPLGVFHCTSATTAPRPLTSLAPPLAMPLEYFRDSKGVPRGVAKMPGEGPTWVTAYVSLRDAQGTERLVGTYAKIRNMLEAYEIGLCVWNDELEQFEPLRTIWKKSEESPKPPLYPDGHPAIWQDGAGKEWLLFGNPFPAMRCRPTFEGWQDSANWERLTPQAALRSAVGDEEVLPHAGSIAWSDFRKRWITVFHQRFGKPSSFGEVWYAESDAPTGPWGPAVKILSHDNYTFYNLRLHADFTDNRSPVMLFEGTYTTTFADRPQPTPRYDYNQILYRLDLDDSQLAPAHASGPAHSSGPALVPGEKTQ